ncbi:hypothetical protein WA538_001016 [Blastocystis sp. DL]
MMLDLLILNGLPSLQRIGSVYSSNLQCIIGGNAFGDDADARFVPTTSMDLYMLNQSLCLFQIRSQPKEGLAASFAHDLMALLQEWKVSNVILFSCADSTFYDISEVRETFAYYTTSSTVLKAVDESIPSIDIPHIHLEGTGLLATLRTLFDASNITYTIFIGFVTEGSNFNDAIRFIQYINAVFHFIPETIQIPSSWKRVDSWAGEEIV